MQYFVLFHLRMPPPGSFWAEPLLGQPKIVNPPLNDISFRLSLNFGTHDLFEMISSKFWRDKYDRLDEIYKCYVTRSPWDQTEFPHDVDGHTR